jgi:TonB family protein
MLMAAVGIMLSVATLRAQLQMAVPESTPGSDAWGKLVAANNLDVKGNSPFHLGMTFQLYDLNGKATETGSFETWWAAPRSGRSVVHLAGLNENGSAPEGADAATVRYSYLVRQLLESAVHPVPPEPRLAGSIMTKTVNLGKAVLNCAAPDSGPSESMNTRPTTVCAEPQKADVLLIQGLGGKELILRPRTGKFHDTYVALDLRIAYLGIDAIAGKVTTLQSFDPATSEVKLPAESQPKAEPMSGGVIAGHRIQFKEPSYPPMAKMQHASGYVLLNVIIGEDGSVERITPIASTHEMFTDEAMRAVKQWRYSPYLLNGKPTKVDTTVTVNFELFRS